MVVKLLRKISGKFKRSVDWVKNVKIVWGKCPKVDVVIFESTNSDYLLPLCNKHKIEILDVPISKLYFDIRIIFVLVKFLLKGNSLQVSCYLSLINTMDPAIVITFIDNSDMFYKVARAGRKYSRYLAIQNASRYDVKELPVEKGNQIYIPEFACFGEYERVLYSSKSAHVEHFYPVGSLRESYYRKQRNKQKTRNKPAAYDLCVVAEASPGWDKIYPGFEDAIGMIAQFAVRLSQEKGLKMVIAGKRDVSPDDKRAAIHSVNTESTWYEKYIGHNIPITPRIRDQFTTYELISKSRLSLAMVSTALYEGASRGARVLFCNYSGNTLWDFPVDGMMTHKDPSYESFSEKVMSILEMDENDYHDNTKDDVEYVIKNNNEIPTDTFLEEHISKAIYDKFKI